MPRRLSMLSSWRWRRINTSPNLVVWLPPGRFHNEPHRNPTAKTLLSERLRRLLTSIQIDESCMKSDTGMGIPYSVESACLQFYGWFSVKELGRFGEKQVLKIFRPVKLLHFVEWKAYRYRDLGSWPNDRFRRHCICLFKYIPMSTMLHPLLGKTMPFSNCEFRTYPLN